MIKKGDEFFQIDNQKIELDKTKSPQENAQRYYKLYTKSKTTKDKSLQMLNSLNIEKEYTGVLEDSCMKNAIDNIARVLSGKDKPACTVEDAIYPLYVARALEESWNKKGFVIVIYE